MNRSITRCRSLSFVSLVAATFLAAGPTVSGFARDRSPGDEAAPETDGNAPAFVRGDANGDGETNLSDTIHLLRFLFQGGEEPPCAAAADANDDEAVDLADAVAMLRALFEGGASLPSPWPKRGIDPTPGLPCASGSLSQKSLVFWVPRLPDLEIAYATVFYAGLDKRPVLQFGVRNTGNATAGPFRIHVRAANGAVLDSFERSVLHTGNIVISFYHLLPKGLHCGEAVPRYIVIDPYDTVPEWDESDNSTWYTYVEPPC